MKARLLAMLCCGCLFTSAENLTPWGDFEASAESLKPFVESKIGLFSIVEENPGRNHCVKVAVKNIENRSDGELGVHSNAVFSLELEPNTRYYFTFDLKGTAPRFLIDVKEEKGRKLPLDVTPPPALKSSYYEMCSDWREYAGTFKTSQSGKVKLFVTLWHSTQYGKMFYAVGDYYLLDNLKLWK